MCRARRGPTRTGLASSAAHRAPAATGLAWLVPATYPSAEVSRGQPSEEGGAGGRVPPACTEVPKAEPRGGVSAAVLTERLEDPQRACRVVSRR